MEMQLQRKSNDDSEVRTFLDPRTRGHRSVWMSKDVTDVDVIALETSRRIAAL